MTDTAPGLGVVLYDADCAFCRRTIRIVKSLDWLHTMHYQNARDTGSLPSCATSLNVDRLIEEMHVVPPSRDRSYAGFRAVRWMFWRLPAVAPLTPLLYIPGVPWLGQKIYRWIARNRFKLVPCDEHGCRLPLQQSKSATGS